MIKLGIVIDGTDHFIRDHLIDWSLRYKTEIFSFSELKLPFLNGRINQYRKKYALSQFLRRNDTVFFEWSGPTLIEASHMPVKTRLITRLWSYELFEFAPDIQWQSVDRVVLVGRAMERRFCETFPGANAKTVVISGGIKLDLFSPNYDNHNGVIGMLGELVPIKRVYEVILAVHELNTQGYNFTLRLGGLPVNRGADNKRYYAALKHLVSKLDMTGQVYFDGFFERPEKFFHQLDIFLSNSYWESQHLALVEAMATGCFCLGHGWDGIEDILPADNIYYSNADLLDKIITYWRQPDKVKFSSRSRLSEIARDKFDFNVINQKLRNVIERE